VPTEPQDMRKPLLQFLMQIPERRNGTVLDRIFRELGEFLAVAWLETEWLLGPAAKARILFGGLVTQPARFSLIVEGARRLAPQLELIAADEIVHTPLMTELKCRHGGSVAQFGQAIGAVHYANCRLQLAQSQLGRNRISDHGSVAGFR
jgi:hypothetical protein